MIFPPQTLIWYPYAQQKLMRAPLQITKAQGCRLFAGDKALIDGISSWWCAAYGYNHPYLIEALQRQAGKLSHVMLAGITHAPAQKLAELLSELLPPGLCHTFFADSGSVGCETALKIAYQYQLYAGAQQRSKILSLKHGYHGDTMLTMAVSDVPSMHGIYQAQSPWGQCIKVEATAEAVQAAFAAHGREALCFILEPLLQGAGGMRMHEVKLLKLIRRLCTQYGAVLIFDEVATGCGRLGPLFVSSLVTPDIVILGKALTGGCLGHAAVVASDKIFAPFYAEIPGRALMHGPTFMGNPLACAAALAAFELYFKAGCKERVAAIESQLKRELSDLQHPDIVQIRIKGACACIEAKAPSCLQGACEYALEHGVLLRPIGACLYTLPPYLISPGELTQICAVMRGFFAETVL